MTVLAGPGPGPGAGPAAVRDAPLTTARSSVTPASVTDERELYTCKIQVATTSPATVNEPSHSDQHCGSAGGLSVDARSTAAGSCGPGCCPGPG
ncbi:hypothetical protein ACFFX0_19225 [Citricoccus parietis]|uniref:Uncharacterized protein n=1 Tax=Citricoccus parietis TaxID=592307 RepID=A0ABV5G2Q9_9MICC